MGVKGPTAKTILKRSIEDIEAGNWCQGEIGKRNGTSTACAVGLLSMHGNFGKQVGKWFIPHYPTHDDAPTSVLSALEMLYNALPKDWKRQHSIVGIEDPAYRIEQMNEAVIEYNDRTTTKRAKAASWFKKALALTA